MNLAIRTIRKCVKAVDKANNWGAEKCTYAMLYLVERNKLILFLAFGTALAYTSMLVFSYMRWGGA